MQTLYIDESGDHNLIKVDPYYPIFVLGGVLVDQNYHDRVISPELERLKVDCFNDPNVVLHLYDVKKKRGAFASLQDKEAWMRFWSEMTNLMEKWDYSVIACAIRKHEHVARYGTNARDPYLFALEIVVERFTMHLNEIEVTGNIIAESRRPDLDREFISTYDNLRTQGTGPKGRYIHAANIQKRIAGVSLLKKRDNIAGLQLADFVLSPIGRHLLGKRDEEAWSIVERKFRCDPETGNYKGWGLVELPR